MLENMSDPVKSEHAHTARNYRTNPENFRKLSSKQLDLIILPVLWLQSPSHVVLSTLSQFLQPPQTLLYLIQRGLLLGERNAQRNRCCCKAIIFMIISRSRENEIDRNNKLTILSRTSIRRLLIGPFPTGNKGHDTKKHNRNELKRTSGVMSNWSY